MGSIDPQSRGAVLVVDDDEGLRAELRDTLEAEHYFVVEARDGIDALEVLGSPVGSAVRLVILDLLMPFMTGWELVQFLCDDPRFSHLSLLVMSGLPVHGDASGIGATKTWIRKPFGAPELLAAVRTLLERDIEFDSDASAPRPISRAPLSSRHDG